MSYRDAARRALESSAARVKQNEFIQSLSTKYEAYKYVANVEALIATLRDVHGDKDIKDALLLALVIENQRGGGVAFALLATAMFPVLDKLYRARLHRMREHDDFWGRIVGAFAEALERYPTMRRPTRVAANIEGETMGALRRAALQEKRAAFADETFGAYAKSFGAEISTADMAGNPTLQLSDVAKSKSAKPAPATADEYQAAEAALEPHLNACEIGPQDRFLILGVNLYEKTLGELAQELGISRDAAKKRHLRAMERLKKSKSTDDES